MRGDPSKTGVHAFKERKRARWTYGGGNYPVVIGTIALWGEVIEHEMGYRAEFGQVASLDEIINGDEALLVALRKTYLENATGPNDDRTEGKQER